jgi:hypothetical protein
MKLRASRYSDSVFLNCPFDDKHEPIRMAMIFAIYDCGFVPRCALEIDDGSDVRINKIIHLIRNSKFGIHDLCRTELDHGTRLPRFNMPLELGIFLAAKSFGSGEQKKKSCLILDSEQYRYQAFISDIAGHDIRSHKNSPHQAITHVRNWLSNASGRDSLPGGLAIIERYRAFRNALGKMCGELDLDKDDVTYNDYSNLVTAWLTTYSESA